MDYSKKWKTIDILGEGGQGKVYRVFELEIDSKIKSSVIDTLKNIVISTTHHEITKGNYERFFEALSEMLKMQDPSQQGALKVLHKLEEARDADLAKERIKREIKAMSDNLHTNLIKILDVDQDSEWYVSQFYPNGTLWDKREMFKGNFPKALKAIRPLVEAVSKLHKQGYIHRDIKPQNVFLNSNNDLILGDFGLIYFVDGQHTRISETYENVGSRDWMPPWAMGFRIEEVKPTFDVFSLGKLLWSMVSGKSILQLWYFDRDEFNVEKMFPKSQTIKYANSLFKKCIVENEEDCLPNAKVLLSEIDILLEMIDMGLDEIGSGKKKKRIGEIEEKILILMDEVEDNAYSAQQLSVKIKLHPRKTENQLEQMYKSGLLDRKNNIGQPADYYPSAIGRAYIFDNKLI